MIYWKDILIDTVSDAIRMLPFLFIAFLLIEGLERFSGDKMERLLRRLRKAGPLIGAALGLVPQCGFSVMAANLYAGGILSAGTLIAVFLSTSDEAILIMLANPGREKSILALLAVKFVIGVIGGYFVDFFLARFIAVKKESGVLCTDCGCEEETGILKPALKHTLKTFCYLFIVILILNAAVGFFGIDKVESAFLGNSFFQPVLSGLVGLIPNCGASVILTSLYLNKILSFGAVISGLSAGSGVGFLALFRVNKNTKENLKLLLCMYMIAVISGIICDIIVSIAG
ncbi:MAG: arsenic efflux protein [Lachnospiraceae bacterium]|jgi:hypothetical protein|nr:arsenic efflux protein [Lachnospiraceae bacterium]